MSLRLKLLVLRRLLRLYEFDAIFSKGVSLSSYSSHVSYELAELTTKYNIIVLSPASNTTHILQATGLGFFGPIKYVHNKHLLETSTKAVTGRMTVRDTIYT